MTEKTLTTENIKPALDALRGELAPWPVVAKKQDRLSTAQLNAANSGITSSLVAQIIANTAAIRALESAITGTGLRALVVATLPAVGTTGILYIVPVTTYDPDTDADVVNYSNEYIWIPVEGGTASEGHYEQVGQTGIVINNGQLNITVNGTSVGTFTANQSGDTTAAITVPTNADYVDRTTDQTVAGDKTWTGEQSFTLPIVGSITGTAAKAIADEDGTSIKTGYVNVAGNQTVSGQKTWTGENSFSSNANFGSNVMITGDRLRLYDKNDQVDVTPSSSITKHIYFTDKNGTAISYFAFQHRSDSSEPFRTCWRQQKLDGTNNYYSIDFNNLGEFYPETANVSLGSSSYQWSSVYAQTYYYNGTAWGLDQNNTWSGTQTFTANTFHKNNNYETGNTPASNIVTNIYLADKNSVYLGYLRNVVYTSGRTATEIRAKNAFKNNVLDPTGADISSNLNIEVQPGGAKTIYWDGSIRNALLPYTTDTYNIGSTTNQWLRLYAKFYYYDGIQWGLDQNNTWSGTNTFSNVTTMQERLTLAGDRNAYLTPMWAGSGSGLCLLTGDASKPVYLGNYVASGNHYTCDSSKGYLRIYTGEVNTINTVVIEPVGTDTQLGTSTNKWKTLNGINPGALSLPDKSRAISIDTTNFVYGSDFTFTPTVSGWLFVGVANCTRASLKTGVGEYYFNQSSGIFRDTVPVIAGEQVTLLFVSTATSAPTVTLYPCLGNV